MELGPVIGAYLQQLGCTAKTLAEESGISPIQLSRWRSGSRRPSPEMLGRLAAGIAALSGGALAADAVFDALRQALPPQHRSCQEGMGRRLDLLLSALKIRTSEVARVLNFDPSYLSRIRSGKRSPANTGAITEGVSRFIVRRCLSDGEKAMVAELIGTDAAALADAEDYYTALLEWLRGGAQMTQPYSADVSALLAALNDFDPNEYLRAIRLDEEAASDSPDAMPDARSVTGLKNMMECELDFFRATALSGSKERVLLYSDMPPLRDQTMDPEYPKLWMLGIAKLIKKGLRVDIIHSVDRPIEELLLGMEVHLPMYMTGRIAPFYLKESNHGPFRHLLEVSGAAALVGEAISGHHAEGSFRLTVDPKELHYYQRRAQALIEKAAPLMDIYTEERVPEFFEFLADEAAHGFEPVRLDMPAFRNVIVKVCHDRWAVVAKDGSPRIAFVIRHPKLVDAIERFAAPLVDN